MHADGPPMHLDGRPAARPNHPAQPAAEPDPRAIRALRIVFGGVVFAAAALVSFPGSTPRYFS